MVTSDVSTPTLTNAASGSTVKYWKCGKVVTVYYDVTPSTASADKEIFVLANGYRPKTSVQFVPTVLSPAANDFIYYSINSASGSVSLYGSRTARKMGLISFVTA